MRSSAWYGNHDSCTALALFLVWSDPSASLSLGTWNSKDGTPPPDGHTGLYHSAFLYPDRKAIQQVLDAGYILDGAADHGVSEAVYLRDPDDNGVELYRDRPSEDWPRDADGNLAMVNDRLDVGAILVEARI